jgi:hypothetical protein
MASQDGGPLQADSWSDPRDESGYSAEDLITLGFVNPPAHQKLVTDTPALADVALIRTTRCCWSAARARCTRARRRHLRGLKDDRGHLPHNLRAAPHATVHRRPSGGRQDLDRLRELRRGLRDDYVGRSIQPFRIEDEARALEGTNFIVQSWLRPHVVRDGLLITGQQQYSGAPAARAIIEAVGR